MKKMYRRIMIMCVISAMIICVSICQKGREKAKSEDTSDLPQIIVGSDDYPPYNYEDADGEPTGIDVDIAREVFRRIGYQVKFINIQWEKKKELLEKGDIDCIWGSFSIDGREEEYHWTSPYMYSRQVVAVEKNSSIYTLSDLKGKKVVVQSTTKPEEIFVSHTDKRIPKPKEVLSVQNRELLYPFLSKGYADAMAAHETSILQSMKDYDLEYRILEEPLAVVGLGVAFSKEDDRGIEKKLSVQFRKLKEDGTLEKIIGRYLEHPEKYLEVDADEENSDGE